MKTPDAGPQHRERFESLYTETRIAILGYLVRRVSNASDAADLLAETYVVAWRRIDEIPRGEEARLWLFGVARRVLSNFHRHAKVERSLADTLRAELLRQERIVGRTRRRSV